MRCRFLDIAYPESIPSKTSDVLGFAKPSAEKCVAAVGAVRGTNRFEEFCSRCKGSGKIPVPIDDVEINTIQEPVQSGVRPSRGPFWMWGSGYGSKPAR